MDTESNSSPLAPAASTAVEFFTPSQASEITRLAPSTLRKYVTQFRKWLSEGARKQRGRHFSQQDVIILQRIKDLFSDGLRAHEIDLQLENLDLSSLTAQTLTELPGSSVTLDDVQADAHNALETVKQMEDALQHQQDQITSILLELKQIKAALFRAKEDQDRLTHRLEEAENTSLWNRLSGRSGKPAGR